MKPIAIPHAFCLLVKRFARELELTEKQIEILRDADLTLPATPTVAADALLGGEGTTIDMLARGIERMVRPQLYRALLKVVRPIDVEAAFEQLKGEAEEICCNCGHERWEHFEPSTTPQGCHGTDGELCECIGFDLNGDAEAVPR